MTTEKICDEYGCENDANHRVETKGMSLQTGRIEFDVLFLCEDCYDDCPPNSIVSAS